MQQPLTDAHPDSDAAIPCAFDDADAYPDPDANGRDESHYDNYAQPERFSHALAHSLHHRLAHAHTNIIADTARHRRDER
jgi:hypothetical protein